MKYRVVVLSFIAALLTLPVLGQTTTPQTGSVTPTAETAQREKSELYTRFVDTYRNPKDQAGAYKLACDYLKRFTSDESGQADFLKKVTRHFEREAKRVHVKRLVEENNFDEAFRFGKEMLKSDPNDFVTLFTLVQAGVFGFVNGNKSYQADAAEYAKKAVVLLENDTSIIDREATFGLLYISLGVFYLTADEGAARVYFAKFSELKTVKNDPRMYARVADAIIGAEFKPLIAEFESRFRTPQQRMSIEAKPLRLRVYHVTDFLIDVLARAIALAGLDRRFEHLTPDWMYKLISLYKYRNSGYITGLPEFIQESLNEPFPRPSLHYF